MSQRYLVLESNPREDGMRWRLDRILTSLLPELKFEYRFREGAGTPLMRDAWEAANTQAILSLIADFEVSSHYVMIEAGARDLVDRITESLRAALPVISLSELQTSAASGNDPRALVRLAQGTDPLEIDQRSAEIIVSGLDHMDPIFRYRAAEAAGLVANDDLRSRLKLLARNDPDDAVRGMARAALEAQA